MNNSLMWSHSPPLHLVAVTTLSGTHTDQYFGIICIKFGSSDGITLKNDVRHPTLF